MMQGRPCQVRGNAHTRTRNTRPSISQQGHHRQRCSCTATKSTTIPPSSRNFPGRREIIQTGIGLVLANLYAKPVQAQATGTVAIKPEVLAAFRQALAVQGGFQEKDDAWTKVINLAPESSAAWSNRGTLRLQYARWADAESDLAHAVALEALQGSEQAEALKAGPALSVELVGRLEPAQLEGVDPSTLNNLGNAEVAAGKYSQAQAHFQAASRDPGLRAIALANLALCAFEDGNDTLAIRVAKQILRRDPAFLDARAALVAFLYGSGKRGDAEGQWEELQEAEDGLGGYLYNRNTAVARVRSRWPPRATAALTAFLSLSQSGSAQGYDMEMHEYNFGV